METSFIVKDSKCQVYFFGIHPMEVTVQKIQSL
jgi:hypothetical protein